MTNITRTILTALIIMLAATAARAAKVDTLSVYSHEDEAQPQHHSIHA